MFSCSLLKNSHGVGEDTLGLSHRPAPAPIFSFPQVNGLLFCTEASSKSALESPTVVLATHSQFPSRQQAFLQVSGQTQLARATIGASWRNFGEQ